MKTFLDSLKFFWLSKVFLLDETSSVSKLDVFQFHEKQSSCFLYKKIQEAWDSAGIRRKKEGKSTSLVRVIMDLFGVDILFLGFMQLIYESFIRALLPLIMVKLLKYFEEESKVSKSEACYWAAAITVCLLIRIHCWHYINNKMIFLGIKIRIACSSLIYKKILNLSDISFQRNSRMKKVVSLLTTDVAAIEFAFYYLHYVWIVPLQVILVVYIIYDQISFIAISGTVVFILLILVQGMLVKVASRLRFKIETKSDERLRIISDAIAGIQLIKMLTWEKLFMSLIDDARKKETNAFFKLNILNLVSVCKIIYVSRLALLISFVAYATFNKFMPVESFLLFFIYSLDLQNIVNYFFPQALQLVSNGLSSMTAIEEFMMLDEREERITTTENTAKEHLPTGTILLQNVTAKRNPNAKQNPNTKRNPNAKQNPNTKRNPNAKQNPNAKPETLKSINLLAKAGSFTSITGEEASGKSSLLRVIIRELPLLEGTINVYGKIAYVKQNPWIYCLSIRQNILFNNPMNQERYDKVIRICQLEKDIFLFPLRDQTIIGEKGTNLNESQKAKLALARAVYSDADIFVLDDLFVNIDPKTAKLIFKKCLCDFLKEKTRILVTSNVQFLRKVDYIYIINNGEVKMEGTYPQLQGSFKNYNSPNKCNDFDNPFLIDDEQLILENGKNKKTNERNEQYEKTDIGNGMNEKTNLGNEYNKKADIENGNNEKTDMKNDDKVSGYICLLFELVGNSWIIIWLILIFANQLALTVGDFITINWITNYESCNRRSSISDDGEIESLKVCPEAGDIWDFISMYSSLIGIAIVSMYLTDIIFCKIYKNAANGLHSLTLESIIQGSMSFFYINPSRMILNRFWKNMEIVDKYLPKTIYDVVLICCIAMSVMGLTVVANFWLLLLIIATGFTLYLLTRIYLATSKNLKQFIHISQSSVLKVLNDTIQDLVTIRTHNAEELLTNEFHQCQDLHTAVYNLYLHISHSFRYFVDIIFAAYFTIICYVCILLNQFITLSDIRLIILQSFSIIGIITWGLFQITQLKHQLTSVKQILQFSKIEQETSTKIERKVNSEKDRPIAIEFRKVYFRYSPHGIPVLKNINFLVGPREKIGIVGKDGSVASFAGALFRLGLLEGEIFVDDTLTIKIPLWKLRSKISIVPQQPLFFSGSLRRNLDPFEEFSDNDVYQVLHATKLTKFVVNAGGLEANVAHDGIIFDTGKQQLICLARELLKKNKILILEEATVNTDSETEVLIQKTVDNEFKNCTIFVMCRRKNTMMGCDKIIVLDDGRLMEFGHPLELMKKKNGFFHEIVENFALD